MKRKYLFGGNHPTIYHPFVFALVPPELQKKTLLDIGCGKGVWGFMIRAQRDLAGSTFIGIDLNETYLDFAKKHRVYNKLLKTNLKKKLPLLDQSVDFIICSEVIEHIKKDEGFHLLDEIERIIKPGGRVIITTPNVWLESPFDEPLDKHYSLWNPQDFKKRGFHVKGLGIKIPFNKIGWYTPIVQALYYITTPLSYIFPPISGLLVAYKDY